MVYSYALLVISSLINPFLLLLFKQFFDGEFHYMHHLNPEVNFAEEEWIDFLFGTHHTYSNWWKRRQAKEGPLLKRRVPAAEEAAEGAGKGVKGAGGVGVVAGGGGLRAEKALKCKAL